MKRLPIILSLLLSLTLLLSACGEYNPAVKLPGNSHGTEADTPEEGVVTDEHGEIDKNPFTVTLKVGDEVYVPS
jgi:hypothetical protein